MVRQTLLDLGLFIVKVSCSHLFTHTTLGRTPLYEWSAQQRDLYQLRHDTHKKQTYMPPAVFEQAIPASERQQGSALWYTYLLVFVKIYLGFQYQKSHALSTIIFDQVIFCTLDLNTYISIDHIFFISVFRIIIFKKLFLLCPQLFLCL